MVEERLEGNRLFGFYRGQVLKHCNQGKCKIWIPSVWPSAWLANPDMLPSAEQASPLFGGSFGGNGVFSWPDIGSIVWCFFLNGDLNLPVYFASTLGGIDAYDLYIKCANADSAFLNEKEDQRLDSTVEMSRTHRINIGKSSCTFLEDGTISAKTEFPTLSTTGTMGANCTYAEYLAHFYADKGLWGYEDIFLITNGTLRTAIGVKKRGVATMLKNQVKSDIAAKPPELDAFFCCDTNLPDQAVPIDSKIINEILEALTLSSDGSTIENTTYKKTKSRKLSLLEAIITVIVIIIEMWGQSIWLIVAKIIDALTRKRAIEALTTLISVSGTTGTNMLIPAELMSGGTKTGIYFCTVGMMFDYTKDGKFEFYDNEKVLEELLSNAKKGNYALFVCQADFFLSKPIVAEFDMANKRLIDANKEKIQAVIDKLAAKYETNILAICPKHTYSDFVMTDYGSLSTCAFNDFTQISSKLNIDVDGKLSAWTSHLMSADMMSSDSWQDLGLSFSRASIDSAGNTFLDGVYTTKTTEVSCLFDMTTKQHIKAELNSADVDPNDRHKKKSVICAYDCDTLSGIADLSVIFYDFDSGDKTYSKIRMTKDGEVYVNCTDKLDVLVKKDNGSDKSHMKLTLNGDIEVDSSKTIGIKAPSISIEGDKVVIEGDKVNMTGKTSTDILGKSGDCKIERVSLVKHVHHCGNGTTNVPIKL